MEAIVYIDHENEGHIKMKLRSVWGVPGEVLPYKGLMETCGPSRYGFRGFCLTQGIDLFTLSSTGYLFLANVLNRERFGV